MKIKLDDFAFEPVRVHATDAGLDLRAAHGACVKAKQSATIHTGVHVELPPNCMGDIRPKSGLMFKHNLLTFGTVDEGFDGEIQVHIFNLGNEDYTILPGDKIAQLVITKVEYEPIEITDSIKGGERGARGYGSTGR